MPELFFPMAGAGAGSSVSMSDWQKYVRSLMFSGVIDGYGDELQVYADSTGMQVKVRDGAFFVAGFYYENTDDPKILPITAAHATLARKDRVVVRLNVATNTIALAVLAGTAAATPVAPALTQTLGGVWEESLAVVDVAAADTTIEATSITDERVYAANVGIRDVQSGHVVNEFKGFPAYVGVSGTPDLNALNLWWDQHGAPTSGPHFRDTAGAGIEDRHEFTLYVITSGSDQGGRQRFTYADEPRVKAGKQLSVLVDVYVPAGRTATLRVACDTGAGATPTDATSQYTGRWERLKVEAHPLTGTYVDVSLIVNGAGTTYFVPLGACIGPRAFALPPRALRYVDVSTANVVNAVDPNGATWTDVDLTSVTSPLAAFAQLVGAYLNATAADNAIFVRRNGDAAAANGTQYLARTQTTTNTAIGSKMVALDDGQIFEYLTGAAAGDTETVRIHVAGYWEWS